MKHFIITYRVFIDSSSPFTGLTGNVVPDAKHSKDYKPLKVADHLKAAYSLQYPRAHHIRVLFDNVQPVDEALYNIASQAFTMPLGVYEMC